MAYVEDVQLKKKKSKKKSRKAWEDQEMQHTSGLENESMSSVAKRKSNDNDDEDEEIIIKKVKKKLKKSRLNNEYTELNNSFLEDMNIEFKERHLATLLNRIEDLLPEDDVMSFKNRSKKIDWVQVAFKGYSPKVCYTIWNLIQRRMRQNRNLQELICDARAWVNTKWLQNVNPAIHPDYPQRPITSPYQLFYAQAKEHIVKMKPDIEEADINKLATKAYRSLEPHKLAVYEKAAADNKAKYRQAVDAFYELHPDLHADHGEKEKPHSKGPVKPMTPFALYVKDQLEERGEFLDKFVVREACKEEWKAMDDKEKVYWIDKALELEKKYFEEVNKNPSVVKSILSKQEQKIKEVMAGKPQKPPTSAYGLFTQTMYKSKELNDVLPQEKMSKIAIMWKVLPEAEKANYKKEVGILMENYKIQLEKYNESLKENEEAEDCNLSRNPEAADTSQGKEDDSDDGNDSSSSNSGQNPVELLKAVIPKKWVDMKENDKNMYLKYIEKIRNYFDEKLTAHDENGELTAKEEEELSQYEELSEDED